MAGSFSYDTAPPFRAEPRAPDAFDGRRIAYVRQCWSGQDAALLQRDRTLEENIRMLAGQQWCEWSPLLAEWVDVSQWQTDEERRRDLWPVVNLLLPWCLTSHARLTENPPVLTFEPGPDAVDAQLAEVLDTVFKTLWRETGMPDRWDEAAAWLIATGRAYIQSRLDLSGGPMREWRGFAELPTEGPDGQPMLGPDGQPVLQPMHGVPFDQQGQPLMRLTPDGPQTMGEPYRQPEGRLVVEVLSPLEVRGEWGPSAWHEKRWHATRTFLTPAEVLARWGVQAEATLRGGSGDGSVPYLRRLLLSAGHFGAAGDDQRRRLGGDTNAGEQWVEVTTLWCRQSATEPGRLTVVTPEQVLFDGAAPELPYTSPIRAFDFVKLPGRVHGSTPLEQMVPIQRGVNRGWKQILEHRALCTNPIFIVDKGSGLQNLELTLAPGEGFAVNVQPGIPPLQWIAPPPLSGDVYRTQQLLVDTLIEMGQLRGTEGAPPTDDASGELVKELRFNSDRYLGPTMRRATEEFGRMAEDWRALLPLIWDRQKTISYAGEDNVVRVLTVEPHLWEQGRVNVIPDTESMLPEGRGERQARVYQMWRDGMFGLPQSPPALKAYFDLARFPHLGRAMRPGGPDRIMAEHTLGALLEGTPNEAIPWFPWYDESVHLDVLGSYMKGPEFLKQPPPVQQQLAHRWETLTALAQQKAFDAARQAAFFAGGGPLPLKGGKPANKGGPSFGRPLAPEPGSRHAPASVPGRQYPTDPALIEATP